MAASLPFSVALMSRMNAKWCGVVACPTSRARRRAEGAAAARYRMSERAWRGGVRGVRRRVKWRWQAGAREVYCTRAVRRRRGRARVLSVVRNGGICYCGVLRANRIPSVKGCYARRYSSVSETAAVCERRSALYLYVRHGVTSSSERCSGNGRGANAKAVE